MRKIKTGFVAVSVFLALVFLSGCSGGVSNVKWIPQPGATPAFEPYSGEMVVIWREYGFPEGYKSKKYYLLGKISGRSLWCGVTPPIRNEELQKRLIEEARKYGGNGIILECGYGGSSEGQCYCYGDVIRFTNEKK